MTFVEFLGKLFFTWQGWIGIIVFAWVIECLIAQIKSKPNTCNKKQCECNEEQEDE